MTTKFIHEELNLVTVKKAWRGGKENIGGWYYLKPEELAQVTVFSSHGIIALLNQSSV